MLSSRFAPLAAILLSTSTVHAYCRTHTLDKNVSSCEVCPAIGLPVAWPKRTIEYAFNQKPFPDLTDAQLRSIIAESAAAWEAVECDGESVGVELLASEVLSPLGGGPMAAEPNTNVIAHYDAARWQAEALPNKALAITLAWFETRNGDMIGADMMFNGAMGSFGPCSNTGCAASETRNDLQNVATHEFGHFLGLAHTPVLEATMVCGAQPGEIVKRTLEKDDTDGLCEIYPPEELTGRDGALSPADGKSGGGCQLSGTDASGMWPLLMLFWRRRRQRAR